MFNDKTIIYILITIVLIGGVTFGISTVDNIQEKQDTVTLTKFLLELDKAISKTKDNFGKVIIEEFRLPDDIERICFIDLKSDHWNMTGIKDYPVIVETYEAGIEKNMFLIRNDGIEPYYNPFVRLNGNKTLCFNPNEEQRIELRFTGVGNSSKLEILR